MAFVAIIATTLGLIFVIYGLFQRYKAGRLLKAPFASTGDVASRGSAVADPKGAVSVQGEVKCAAPLIAPASGTPCLYYELKVVGKWKDGDSTQSKDYVDEKRCAEFTLDDGSGAVRIDASEGGDFEPFEKTFEQTKKEGFFADLKNAVGKKEPIVFGQYQFDNPPMSKANEFVCVEKVLKVQPRLFVLGKHESGRLAAPKWTSMIVDARSRDELLGATAKSSKRSLIGGGVALAAGVILGIVSNVMAPATPVTTAGNEAPAAVAGASSENP